jgi:hypothetical protein
MKYATKVYVVNNTIECGFCAVESEAKERVQCTSCNKVKHMTNFFRCWQVWLRRGRLDTKDNKRFQLKHVSVVTRCRLRQVSLYITLYLEATLR